MSPGAERGNTSIPMAIVFLGLILRLYRIDWQSIWYDEALSLTISKMSFVEIAHYAVHSIETYTYPPFYFWLLHAWLELFGFGALQSRILSAIFGALSVFLIYLLSRYLFDRKTAQLSALLLAISQLGVLYSHETRPYTLLLFLFILSWYLLTISFRKKLSSAWWGFICSSILMLFTHYYAVFVLLCMITYVILYRKQYNIPYAWLIGGAITIIAIYGSWMTIVFIERYFHNPKNLLHEWPPWFSVDWKTIFRTINQFNNGKSAGVLNRPPRWNIFIGGLIFTVPAFFALLHSLRKTAENDKKDKHLENAVFLLTMFLIPLFIIIGLGFCNFPYDVRYVSFLIAPYYILIAYGINNLKFRRLRLVIIISMVIYSLYSLRANYFIPYKENYRDALAYLTSEYKNGDCCVFLPFGEIPLQLDIYQPDHQELNVTSISEIENSNTERERVWVITYHRVKFDIERDIQRLENTHIRINRRRYFWVDVDLYLSKNE